MVADNSWAYKGVEIAAVEKIAQDLRKQGFDVKTEVPFSVGISSRQGRIDILAEKGNDKRVYEVKIRDREISKEQYELLKNVAKDYSAKLYVVYVERPQSNKIEFSELPEILCKEFIQHKPEKIADFTELQVDVIKISSISLSQKMVKVSGNAIVKGVNGDINDERNFFFNIEYDIKNEVLLDSQFLFDDI